MNPPSIVFIVNLLQDVAVLRPLVFMAARDLGLDTKIFVTAAFDKRDRSNVWHNELQQIARETGAALSLIEDEAQAFMQLQYLAGGALLAASESNLAGHRIVHDIFRTKPDSFVAITLQHGLECVGFLQSRDHDRAHGRAVTFAADIVCGWLEAEKLTALAPSQRGKLVTTGPTTLLQQASREEPGRKESGQRGQGQRGIVCENLHSIRLNLAGDFGTDFVATFNKFCSALASQGDDVTLRPHPGGQYVLKHNTTVASNVVINNHPIYKVNLSRYAYGISAPSSVLVDMVLAGIPTAVWREGTGRMDADNYTGLTQVTDEHDWIAFAEEARSHPERYVEKQTDFLQHLCMPLDPGDVYRRYAELLWCAARRTLPTIASPGRG
ncbi:hypothetical protein LQ948_02245 [Jiella sp. MQZ9-1]|uniref:Uncharacterized protein n=1 Tax=Jiella flava TaxID=2816857 RepID=A0A939JUG3_9HYPH|nr:hypothetical protein [Jiella flava]MBO0661384.1 hypothetical protein [Jiella flava]MCD2470028.1 hypothetical protein [Jiella flava]